MSETTHTPGEWVAECCSLEEAKADGQFKWMSMGHGPYDRPPEFRVGTVWLTTDRGATTGLPGLIETTEAYARLIATAPKLLAACKALVNALNDDLSDEQCEAWDAARAAIAETEAQS